MNNKTAWECYFEFGQIVEQTTNADVLADIELWALQIARQAKAKTVSISVEVEA